MTNCEKIKSMSIAEMAEFFNYLDICDFCLIRGTACYDEGSCQKGITKYLESEVADADNKS